MEITLNPVPSYDITDQGKRNTRQYKKFLRHEHCANHFEGVLTQTILAYEDAENAEHYVMIRKWFLSAVRGNPIVKRTRLSYYLAYCQQRAKERTHV